MHLYQRPKSPYWWAAFTVKGVRHRISTRQTEKRAATIAAARLLQDANAAPSRSDIWTVSHAVATWWDDHAQHTRSAAAIWSNIENLARCLDTKIAVNKLTNADLMDFRARRRGEGVTGPTINRDLAYLHAAWNHAQMIHNQPVAQIAWRRLKYPEQEWRTRFLSIEEYQALIAATDDPALALLILAAVTTGLRRGNLLAIQWHQIDLTGRTISVPTSKGRKPTTVRISAPLADALTAHRTKLAKDSGKVPSGPLFAIVNRRKKWAAAVKAAGLADFRFHDLRHTFGSWARKAGVDLAALKEAMNHSNIGMTLRYAHVDPDTEITAFDRTGDLMQAALNGTPGDQIDTPIVTPNQKS